MAEMLRVESSELRDFEEMCARFAPSARLHRVDPKGVRLRWTSVDLDGTSMVRYSLNATMSSSIRPEDQLFACRVAGRTGWMRSARTELEKGMPWASDGRAVEGYWEGTTDVSALIFDRAHAQDIARQITGDDLLSLRLTAPEPRHRTAGQQWSRAFDYLMTAAAASRDDALIEASLVRHALVTTLTSFPSTFLDAAARITHGAGMSTVRRAVSFVEENAHRPITVDDIARAVHISTRGLQYAFRRRLDTTPTDYLRRVRLESAHRDLQNSTVHDTVTVIARRWGFANVSRFTALYRQMYGRSPKQTLQRD